MEIDVKEQHIADISLDLLKILLIDKTTKSFIRWGTDNYIDYGPEYQAEQEICPDLITGDRSTIIQPRVSKSKEEQIRRTRDKAEVFTPSWVCNEQNNLIDEAWFERANVFNITGSQCWQATTKKITFSRDKIWKDYVDARRMEISCGEAPYLVSRYDTVDGTMIALSERIGLLDRKMRIVNENATSDDEWNMWTWRAFQSCYGYDYQGDNVLLARENMLLSYMDYYKARFDHAPSLVEMKKIANIVAWNIWQMNGITMTVPYSVAQPIYEQQSLFGLTGDNDEQNKDDESCNEVPCLIYDWRAKKSLEFRSIVNGGNRYANRI